jgi:hypothetical protein
MKQLVDFITLVRFDETAGRFYNIGPIRWNSWSIL